MADPPRPSIDPAIRHYYDSAPEESRLETGVSRLEELRSRELILRHAPKAPAIVLDVGGAAGAYAFWLAELGYDVRLFDATPRLVDVARQRDESAVRRLGGCEVADARALPAPSESAEMVLLLGPLYHLVDEHDRQAALSEAIRVLRPGGVLIAAGISRAASALDGLAREMLGDPEFARIVERDLLDGHHHNPTKRLDYFTTAYLHRPEDLRREIVAAGFDVEGLYGVEGPGWMLPDFGDRWEDPRRREMLVRVARSLESEPSVTGCSAHLIVVGRKPPASATIPSTDLLRAALEESIRMGPETRRSVADRLQARAPESTDLERTAALGEAKRAVSVAESLAREYQAGGRSQKTAVAELRRQFPWLDTDDDAGLAVQLGHFGYYLVIM